MNIGRYLLGNPKTRFALMHYPRPRWHIRRPHGGLVVGPFGFWWTR